MYSDFLKEKSIIGFAPSYFTLNYFNDTLGDRKP